MANGNKTKKNKNKKSSKGKKTQAVESQPLPTAQAVALPSALQATGEPTEQILGLHSLVTPANVIRPEGVLAPGRVTDEKIPETSKLAAQWPPCTHSENSHP